MYCSKFLIAHNICYLKVYVYPIVLWQTDHIILKLAVMDVRCNPASNSVQDKEVMVFQGMTRLGPWSVLSTETKITNFNIYNEVGFRLSAVNYLTIP